MYKPVTIEIIDNNYFSQGEPPTLIAEINCRKAVIEIHDAKAFEKYIHKIALNTKATSLMNLYDHDLEKDATIEKYLAKAASQYEVVYSSLTNSTRCQY